ncbi:MAG: molybdopterin-dependent oxidoreductase [Nitrososphaeria archaeon]|nr:molybdopterin-dependent oxidoreductase [Nitrososphaeria archaeon]
MKTLRDRGDPHKLVWLGGDHCSQHALIELFLKAYGSPNFIKDRVDSDFEGDLTKINYLLLLGADIIDGYGPMMRYFRLYGQLRRGRPLRAKMVKVGSRKSVTGVKADEWIDVRPGTLGAFALGLTHVILSENLFDEGFVSANTAGFKEFRELVLGRYKVEWSSEVTGVPMEEIRRIAREFASTKPSIAVLGDETTLWNNGYASKLAVQALNLLVGRVRSPIKNELFREISLGLDEIAKKGLNIERIDLAGSRFRNESVYNYVAEAVVANSPYRAEIFVIHNTNPLFESLEPERFKRALEKVPFIVSTGPLLNEVEEEFADLIIPEPSFLEKWSDYSTYIQDKQMFYASLVRPTISRNRCVGDLLIELSKLLGENIASNFPWTGFEEFIKHRWSGIWSSGAGYVGPEPLSALNSFAEFWDNLKSYGFWYYESQISHKLNRYSFNAHEIEWRDPLLIESEDKYPFVLNVHPLISQDGKYLSNCPWTYEHLTPLFPGEVYGVWAEVNPKDAKRFDIDDGDLLSIENPKGVEIRCKAKIYEGVAEGVIGIPFGLGHRAGGRWAKNLGSNPMELTIYRWKDEYVIDPNTGNPSLHSTRVKVSKVS